MTDRTTARIVGLLFIIATVTAIIGGSMVQRVEDQPLTDLVDQRGVLVTGFLLEVVLVAAVIGIAALLFPVLRRQDEGLAMGYVGARIVEGMLLLTAAMSVVVIVAAAQDDDTSATATAIGSGFVTVRTWSYIVGSMLALGAGALILYWLLFRARLVPTWLSVWGLVAAALIGMRAILELYGLELSVGVQAVLAAPIALNEMVLAGWLILRGFDERTGAGTPEPSMATSGSTSAGP
jgi:hypothetical protein